MFACVVKRFEKVTFKRRYTKSNVLLLLLSIFRAKFISAFLILSYYSKLKSIYREESSPSILWVPVPGLAVCLWTDTGILCLQCQAIKRGNQKILLSK